MLIADVAPNTEYAAVYRANGDWDEVASARRVLVRAKVKGGKVSVSYWDKAEKVYPTETYEIRAANLLMTWAEAIPKRKEVRESKIRQAELAAQRLANEQDALRYIGAMLEGADVKGLPYGLDHAIALANGEPTHVVGSGEFASTMANRHMPSVTLNVTVLAGLLSLAAEKGAS